MQRARSLRYVGLRALARCLTRSARSTCRKQGQPSQANRGPKKQGRSVAHKILTILNALLRGKKMAAPLTDNTVAEVREKGAATSVAKSHRLAHNHNPARTAQCLQRPSHGSLSVLDAFREEEI